MTETKFSSRQESGRPIWRPTPRCLLAVLAVPLLAVSLLLAVPVWLSAETGGPALLEAARRGDSAAVRALLQKKTDVNAAEGDGATALLWASYRNDLESAKLLIRAGAKANAANDLGATPLWAASQNGGLAMVRTLLAAGADPNLALLAGETPLMVAARSGYADVAEVLLSKGANPNARGARNQTALMWAAAQKHPEVVKVLVAHGADVHARSSTYSEMMAVPPHGYSGYNRVIPHGNDTPLLFAARSGDLESAKLLVAAGSGVDEADAWGVTAVTLAAHSDFRDLATFLLEKGANPNLAAAGFTALHAAIMHRDEALVNALLEHGANPNAKLETWTPTRRSSRDFNFAPELVGATPFWLAARFREPGVMRLLAKHGADPLFVQHGDKVVGGRGGDLFPHRTEVTTALMAALGMGGGQAWTEAESDQSEALTLEIAKLMVGFGVDVNAANTNGRTALDGAKAMRYETVAKFLLENGAKPGPSGEKTKTTE